MERESKNVRPDSLLEAMGIDFKGLSEEERAMKTLLVEEYKKRQKSLMTEVKKWREEHPEATLGDSIHALYEELEKKE
ncbi:MAG: hypothetical protein A2W41_00925 [Candidatus Ryanbacteria bacterium RIFCSPHIGHO2_01_45_13]|uniref:Uncharacterized protein n=1 Tax=Candidatus Ryanbacteria bacterium RIFCSPHIGHO2_01_45_13 TaxID=1802112 RepID=A0A1G2FW10_9BACT|nr:MAG: hypothetical protein A2W41_00925 [Candidatus Ryanbacteria bacterium RIFCSPHIGHO2_01_45_13]